MLKSSDAVNVDFLRLSGRSETLFRATKSSKYEKKPPQITHIQHPTGCLSALICGGLR